MGIEFEGKQDGRPPWRARRHKPNAKTTTSAPPRRTVQLQKAYRKGELRAGRAPLTEGQLLVLGALTDSPQTQSELAIKLEFAMTPQQAGDNARRLVAKDMAVRDGAGWRRP